MRTQVCPACSGEGEVPSEPCKDCQGAGRRPTTVSLTVDIPAGIANGQRIRMPGRGAAGGRGARPGDLYVQVTVAEDERFRREGLDIDRRGRRSPTRWWARPSRSPPWTARPTWSCAGTQPND
jgi:molecular chaperone DnaJ